MHPLKMDLSAIAKKFSNLDIHDDTIETIDVILPTKKGGPTSIELTFFRAWEKRTRIVRFVDCANIDLRVDFNVLADNYPINTAGTEASSSLNKIIRKLGVQKSQWNVTYDKKIDPTKIKPNQANRFNLFRVKLFGGDLEVIARSYKIIEV